MRKKHKICVLASGGVESTALLADAVRRADEVLPLYVENGFVWEKAEYARLVRICKKIGSRALKSPRRVRLDLRRAFAGHWSTGQKPAPGARTPDESVYLPGRNAVLLTLAAAFAAPRGVARIEIGTLGSNPFSDATPEFFAKLARALSRGARTPLAIAAPLRRLRKRDLVALLGPDLFKLTFSCLRPSGSKPCGRCNKCAERSRAARDAAQARARASKLKKAKIR